jgi:pimeloyl-ACP methyl ester carboxylesterase
MGGAIAQTLALRKPAWLDKVVLVGTGARLRVHPLILDGLKTNFEATIDTICQWAYGPTASEQILRKGRQQLRSVDPTIISSDYVACNNFDIMDRVKDIPFLTLVVIGSADQMTPPKYGYYLGNQIADAQLVEIKDGGHMMAIEKPAEVTQAVVTFLEML